MNKRAFPYTHLHRITHAFGGDDVTTFFLQNLLRLDFPCSDIDLTRSYDWQLIDGLKESIATLQEVRLDWI